MPPKIQKVNEKKINWTDREKELFWKIVKETDGGKVRISIIYIYLHLKVMFSDLRYDYSIDMDSGYKLVILDEADAMTNDAQNALRRIIEKFTDNVRFCLIGNYLSKIIPALQSWCTRFRFGPLGAEQILPRLEHVCEQEKVSITEDGKQALMTLSQGDMRKVINILQSCNMAFGEVTEDNVYTCTGHPLKSDITNIVNWSLNEDFSTAYKNIQEVKTLKGLSLQDILSEVHLYVHKLDLPAQVRIHLLIKMSELEARLMAGASEKIQLGSLLAAFQVTREMIKPEAEAN